MSAICNSIPLHRVNTVDIQQVCKGYQQEATFISYLQKKKSKAPRLKEIHVCICDSSHKSCATLPWCSDAQQGVYDVLLIDIRRRLCEAVELKLKMRRNTRNIEKLEDKFVKKFMHSCCHDYCKQVSQVVVFAQYDISKKVKKSFSKKYGLRMEFTSLDRLELSVLPND